MATKDTLFRVRISGTDKALRAFLADFPVEPQGLLLLDNGVRADLSVTGAERDELRKRGFQIEREIDETSPEASRLNEVGRGNRFDGGRVPPGRGARKR